MAASTLLSLLTCLLAINGVAAVGRHLVQSPVYAPSSAPSAPSPAAPPSSAPSEASPASAPSSAPSEPSIASTPSSAPSAPPSAPAPSPLAGAPLAPISDACISIVGGNNMTVLMVADPGDFTGSAEAKYYEANMQNLVRIGQGNSYCPSKFTGTLMGQPVLLVTTGIGPGQASICTQEILQCAPHIREIVFSGTAGFSSQLGGVLNNDNCSTVNPSTKVNRMGDLCVTPFSVNWDCKQTDWDMQCGGFPNLCYEPSDILSINASYLYGECIFVNQIPASLALSDEILAGAHAPAYARNTPTRVGNVTAYEAPYWAIMTNQTGVQYAYNASKTPGVYGYTECAEIDSQFFFSGVPFEMVARDYVAQSLNLALNTTLSKKDVQIANAMESIGIAMPIERYNAFNSTVRKIPYTVVRGMSDWLHGTVNQTSPGVWQPGATAANDFVDGYAYAIASYSSLVMTWLQSRCLTSINATLDTPVGNATCGFSLAAYGAS